MFCVQAGSKEEKPQGRGVPEEKTVKGLSDLKTEKHCEVRLLKLDKVHLQEKATQGPLGPGVEATQGPPEEKATQGPPEKKGIQGPPGPGADEKKATQEPAPGPGADEGLLLCENEVL